MNRSPNAGHWLNIALQGVKSNRDGIGARIKVVTKAGNTVQPPDIQRVLRIIEHWGLCTSGWARKRMPPPWRFTGPVASFRHCRMSRPTKP